MITKNIENLSANAKEMVIFFKNHPNINHRIIATTDGCVLDPDIFPHIKNVQDLLEELQNNGNIKNYTTVIDESKTKVTFEFYC